MCTVCAALSVCFREKCCCEGRRGKGVTRLVFVPCAGPSSLACTYAPAAATEAYCVHPGPVGPRATVTHCHPGLSASCFLIFPSLSFISFSHFLPRVFERLIQSEAVGQPRTDSWPFQTFVMITCFVVSPFLKTSFFFSSIRNGGSLLPFCSWDRAGKNPARIDTRGGVAVELVVLSFY